MSLMEMQKLAFRCKGFCEDYRGSKMPNGIRYANGQKRCTLCGLFLDTTNTRCPCCSVMLRTKPRETRGKIGND